MCLDGQWGITFILICIGPSLLCGCILFVCLAALWNLVTDTWKTLGILQHSWHLLSVPWTTCCLTLPALGGWRWGSLESKTQTPGAGESLSEHCCKVHKYLPPVPMGPKKASFLNSSSQLAGIVFISNPWSLRQSSIRSFRRRCLCSCVAPRIYIEVADAIRSTVSIPDIFVTAY